jgi:hypothetical protein
MAAEGRDDRPWEQPGAVRRDCRPHRGDLLVALGNLCLGLGFLSLWFLLPACVAVPLAGVVWLLARRDLVRMKAGLIDPAGARLTGRSATLATLGVLLTLPGLFFAVVLLLAAAGDADVSWTFLGIVYLTVASLLGFSIYLWWIHQPSEPPPAE